jgi:hypothetical protein
LLDAVAAAEHCGLSVSMMAKMRCSGKGRRFLKITGAAVRYDPKDLDAWLESRRRQSTSESRKPVIYCCSLRSPLVSLQLKGLYGARQDVGQFSVFTQAQIFMFGVAATVLEKFRSTPPCGGRSKGASFGSGLDQRAFLPSGHHPSVSPLD